jgi:hypothetical protein
MRQHAMLMRPFMLKEMSPRTRGSSGLLALALSSILMFGVAFPAFAQSGRIMGVVYDAQSNERLPGANVVIQGTSRGAASDLEGRYSITAVPPGEHTLIVSYIGYVSQRQTVSCRSGPDDYGGLPHIMGGGDRR